MRLTNNKDLVAIQSGRKPSMRIIYDSDVETFFLQRKFFFVWSTVEYSFNADEMRRWRCSHGMVWVSRRWMN